MGITRAHDSHATLFRDAGSLTTHPSIYLQAGGSSTKAATSGAMLGKGVAAITRKVDDENMRKRLDTQHVFLAFIKH